MVLWISEPLSPLEPCTIQLISCLCKRLHGVLIPGRLTDVLEQVQHHLSAVSWIWSFAVEMCCRCSLIICSCLWSNIYKHWIHLQNERSNLSYWPNGRGCSDSSFMPGWCDFDVCEICYLPVPLQNRADSLTEQVQAGICKESDGRDKRPACDAAKSQISVLSPASFIFADGHIFSDCLILGLCNFRVHIVAKRVSPGKTISEGEIWFPVCRSVFIFLSPPFNKEGNIWECSFLQCIQDYIL